MDINLSDGTNDLITISEKSKISVKDLMPVVDKLIENGILENEETSNLND